MAFIRKLKDVDYGEVRIAITAEDKVLYCLLDLCKLLKLNMHNVIALYGNKEITYLHLEENNKKVKKAFVNENCLRYCVSQSECEKADFIYLWLTVATEKFNAIYKDLKPEDLSDLSLAAKVLNKINELEVRLTIQGMKIEEDKEKVELLNKIFGTTIPICLEIVPMRLKVKNVNLTTVLEILREAEIINEDNVPAQKYIDEGYFRKVKTIVVKKADQNVRTTTLVYEKGIKLIENLLRKRYGNNERPKKRNSL